MPLMRQLLFRTRVTTAAASRPHDDFWRRFIIVGIFGLIRRLGNKYGGARSVRFQDMGIMTG